MNDIWTALNKSRWECALPRWLRISPLKSRVRCEDSGSATQVELKKNRLWNSRDREPIPANSGDTNRLWSFTQFRRTAGFLGAEDATGGLFQTIHKRGASKRMTGATVFS